MGGGVGCHVEVTGQLEQGERRRERTNVVDVVLRHTLLLAVVSIVAPAGEQ